MTRALAHRGPDGEGLLVRDGVGFGHRRLSIIDLATGAQPMSTEDGNAWVTYNGEVYNYRALRAELEGRGHRFRTSSDTEVVLHAFVEWGPRCVEKLRGMFAFAAVDFRFRRGLLARDPFGIKPLVYARAHGTLAFASEIQSLLQSNAVAQDVDVRALELFFRFQFVPTPFTAFRDIRKLGPGETIQFDLDGQVREPERYFRPQFAPTARNEPEAIDALDAALHESVKAHLVADVPYGVFLSGGVDSSLIALAAAKESGRRLPAFVIDAGEGTSEVEFARQVADASGLELVVEHVGEMSISLLPQLVRHFGEPFGDSSAIPCWHVAKLARSRVPLVLSGDGGDEFFGGYQTYASWLEHKPRLRQSLARAALDPAMTNLKSAADALWWRAAGRRSNVLNEWISRVWASGDWTRYLTWRPQYRALAWAPSPQHERAALDASSADALTFAQTVDIETYLPDDILAKVDITSMMHGLEVRPPLIDKSVFAFARSLAPNLRIKSTPGARAVQKFLPKALLEREMSPEFVHRRKQGFSVPMAEWFRAGRTAHSKLQAHLEHPDPRLRELFQLEHVRGLLKRHAEGENHGSFLWSMLVTATWFEEHPSARVPADLTGVPAPPRGLSRLVTRFAG